MDSVSGDRDDLFLDLDVVDFIVEVEGDVLSLGSLDGLHSHVDIAVDDLQVAGLDELIALGESHIAGVDVNGVVGDRDDIFLDLDVVDLIIEVEGNLLFSRCSALTVQHDGRILRGDPLNTVVGQVKEHRVPGHAGVLLGIPVLDVLLHIGLGVKLDHIHVALDAQAVSLRRVAAVQQAGGDGLMALGGAVHLEVPQENLQSVIRGGDSADLDGGNTVLDVHIARLSYLVAVGNPLVGDAVGVDLRGAYGDVLGIGAAHLLACHHIHKLDGDGDGDRLIDGGQLHIAFGDTKELHSLGIGEAIQGLRGQLHTIISHPVRELLILRGGDFGDSPDDLAAAGVGNISRLRIIEAIRPGALTVVELQGDGNGAVLLDNDLDFLLPGLDRNRVVVDQDVPNRKIQRSRVNFAVVGNGHALGTARHHLTGGLIHKLDTEDHRFGFLSIDGDKRQIAAIRTPHIFLIQQRCKGIIVELARVQGPVPHPLFDGLATIFFGRLCFLTNFNRLSIHDRCIGTVSSVAIKVYLNRQFLIVGCVILIRIDRIEHLKDLIISCPSKVFTGFLGVQHVGVLGIISSKLIGALVVDRLLADFLSSLRIHRIRLSYIFLLIYPEVVDGIAILCLNGRLK